MDYPLHAWLLPVAAGFLVTSLFLHPRLGAKFTPADGSRSSTVPGTKLPRTTFSDLVNWGVSKDSKIKTKYNTSKDWNLIQRKNNYVPSVFYLSYSLHSTPLKYEIHQLEKIETCFMHSFMVVD
jgi:hypothetical protein